MLKSRLPSRKRSLAAWRVATETPRFHALSSPPSTAMGEFVGGGLVGGTLDVGGIAMGGFVAGGFGGACCARSGVRPNTRPQASTPRNVMTWAAFTFQYPLVRSMQGRRSNRSVHRYVWDDLDAACLCLELLDPLLLILQKRSQLLASSFGLGLGGLGL